MSKQTQGDSKVFRHDHLCVLLVAMSLLFLSSCAKQSSDKDSSKSDVGDLTPTDDESQLSAPISIIDAAEYSDGGTTYVRLMDAKNNEILLCVSQLAFDSDIPSNTLFLDANHPTIGEARLPSSTEEATAVLETLKVAVSAAMSEAELAKLKGWGDPLEHFWHEKYSEPESERRPTEEWRAIFAFDALRRLEKQPGFHIRNQSTTPNWYEAYDAKRREVLAQQQQEAELDARFKGYYPEAARNLFDMQNVDYDVAVQSLGNGDSSNEDALAQQGKRLADAVNAPVRLAVITCKALGTLDESWTTTTTRDRIATQAMLTVRPDDFIAALPDVVDDQEALLGAGRIFFYLRYGESFSNSAWQKWGPKITEAVLTEGADDNKPMVLRILASSEYEEVVPVLKGIARGEIGREPTVAEQWNQEPGLRVSAYLALAERGDESIREEVQQLLAQEKLEQNQAALEVCLALLGDPDYIKPEHFEYSSYNIGFGALRAIERFEGKYGMKVLMSSALEHPWAAVANEALLVAQRITGQQWLPEGSNHQPRNFSDDAKAWWNENGERFVESVRAE